MEELKQLMISQNSEVNQNIANLDTKIDTISEDILSIRDVIIKKLQEENSALKERIDKLEETVYHLQDERILSLENKMGNVEKKWVMKPLTFARQRGTLLQMISTVALIISKLKAFQCVIMITAW